MGAATAGFAAAPVFYDVEASSLDGFPIEIGWARADAVSGTILSEGHLIQPPPDWDISGTWDPAAAARHRIRMNDLSRKGRPVLEIARRMNEMLSGSELFADSPFDEPWLLLNKVAGKLSAMRSGGYWRRHWMRGPCPVPGFLAASVGAR